MSVYLLRLWRTISEPPASSQLYTRFYHQPDSTRARSAAVVFSVIMGVFLFSGGVTVLPLFVPLLSPVAGAVWAYSIAGSLRQHVTSCLPLMAVTPGSTSEGTLHAALGVIHRKGRFNDLVGPQVSTIRTIAAGIIALPLVWWFVLAPVDEIPIAVLLLFFLVAFALVRVGFHLVHVACTVMGVLVGITAATFQFSVFVVQLGAVLVYFALFIVATLLAVVLVTALYTVSIGYAARLGELAALLTVVLNGVLLLVIFAAIAEVTVRGAAWALHARLRRYTR